MHTNDKASSDHPGEASLRLWEGEEPWYSHGKPNGIYEFGERRGSASLQKKTGGSAFFARAGRALHFVGPALCDLPAEEIAVALVVGLADDLWTTQKYGGAAQGVLLMIEEQRWVNALSTVEHLEVEVVACCVACGAGESDHLSGLDMLTGVYEVDGLMAIERLDAVGVFHHDAIAITGNKAGLLYDTVKGYVDAVVWRVGLDIHTGMMVGGCGVRFLAQLVIRTGDVAADEWVAPMLRIEKLQVDLCRSCCSAVLWLHGI